MTGTLDFIKDFCKTYNRKTFTHLDVRHLYLGYQDLLRLEREGKIERISATGYVVQWRLTA